MQQKTTRYMNATLCGLLLLLLGASVSLHQFKVPMVMGDVAAQVGMSPGSAPWLMSIFTVAGIFLAIPTGGLVAKVGAKRVVLLAGLFAAGGSLLGAFSTNSTLILVSRAIEGIGFVFVAVAGPSAVISTVEPKRIAGAMGIWSCWVALGTIVAFNLTPVLFSSTGGFQVPWLVYAVVSLLAAFAVKVGIKPPEGLEAPSVGSTPPHGTLKKLFEKKKFLLVALSFMSYCYIFMAFSTFLPGFAIEKAGMSPGEAGFVVSLPMFLCLISAPICGNLAGKIGCKKIYIGTLLLIGAGVALSFFPSRALIYVAVTCIGIGLGHPGIMFAAVGDLVDGDSSLIGLANGVIIALQSLGMFLGTATFLNLVTLGGGSFTTAALLTIPITLLGVVLAGIAKFK